MAISLTPKKAHGHQLILREKIQQRIYVCMYINAKDLVQ